MRIPRIGVVLNGDANDREALAGAVRLAAREHACLRIVLGAGCDREQYEKHLDFAVWEVRTRLGLAAPDVTFEWQIDAVSVQPAAETGRPLVSQREA
ncbi:MAG TPA: hypothetical protein VK009_24510 [Chloroflexota bacterium]|nr:hypothetical protein [Chloroflexota bacterium]